MEKKLILLPRWINEMPDGVEKNAYLNRFYIRLAALYASKDGTLADLSDLIGVNYNSLKSQALSICRASHNTKEGIRKLLGDDFVPPDLTALARLKTRNIQEL